ncbi:putative F-box protein At4g05475 isoform X1 [Arabidopsis lyrata subsp. lyrata]|uniref:putative F-box protein At4g05475 isoform X1 n=1 Tax=Arabidopsis lyrata subsp. lyrata TaxID=81972 RepID=UPI000A29CEA4|nr:putative F-box protein At4g05475 isoform X1 [Arabidopsis lyrata subsp. lyrata]|eukprot:XP_020876443.1 putative F-box protein At4g05475 isoform X1 [Arabidopsis lyrata subsp. lyrata]
MTISAIAKKKMRTSSTSPMKDEEPRNWVDLPSELTSLILIRLSVTDILENARKVCSPWRRICKDPSMWRKIDMRDLANRGILFKYNADSMRRRCRDAVDLSQGGLLEIKIDRFVSDSLLSYIADRSSNLKSLGLSIYEPMTNKGVMNGIAKFPLLETLEVFHSSLKLDLKAIGHVCPQLKTLKLNSLCCPGPAHGNYAISQLGDMPPLVECDDDALAIAESMPKLRHLQLMGNGLTNTGLNVILDRCPHLEHLDVRKCFNMNLVGNLEKRCLERIKELRRPGDSTADYPYNIGVSVMLQIMISCRFYPSHRVAS